jgi:hypothetical protein
MRKIAVRKKAILGKSLVEAALVRSPTVVFGGERVGAEIFQLCGRRWQSAGATLAMTPLLLIANAGSSSLKFADCIPPMRCILYTRIVTGFAFRNTRSCKIDGREYWRNF